MFLAASQMVGRAPLGFVFGSKPSPLSVSPSSVAAGTPVTLTATIDDRRFSTRNGTEAVQAIRSSTAFLDQKPWTSNATRHAMAASDGRFDETAEATTLNLSTTGLAAGRHVVFVQGTDTSGRAGTPQAVYFTVQ